MLERRGVEHDLRVMGRHDFLDPLRVTKINKNEAGGVEQRATLDRELNSMERRLIMIEHDKCARGEAVDLTAELRTDRAAGTRDQDTLAGEVSGDRLDVR